MRSNRVKEKYRKSIDLARSRPVVFLPIRAQGCANCVKQGNAAQRNVRLASLFFTTMLIVGCVPRMVVPDNPVARACVADAESKRDLCEVTVSQNHQSCLQRARASAQTEYAQANAAYQADHARWERERERERQQAQRADQQRQREFERCRREQERVVAQQPLVDRKWAIEYNCGDPLRRGGGTAYYGPPEPRRPSIDDFVDADGCERESRRSEDFCDSEFEAQVRAACGVTFK